MNTVEKGNSLEDNFHSYLCDQQNRGALVYDAYVPELCKIHKKKKYYCGERERDVEFDVVIELFRQGSTDPQMYVVFECKNHQSAIQERDVREFSDKIGNIFRNANKGVLVITSRLQSGAEKVARNRNMGIVKFDKHGLDTIAERKGGIHSENKFVKSQILSGENQVKSLKFSAYHDESYFSSIDQFLRNLDPNLTSDEEPPYSIAEMPAPFLNSIGIQQEAENLLETAGYQNGSVDLARICSLLSIDLTFTEQTVQDANGELILGTANFDYKTIQIHSHDNKNRERFTIGHEIGHFYLRHDRYLRSESIVRQDLLINNATATTFNFERLEYQANSFASSLLLPKKTFVAKLVEYREKWKIENRGHGYIFVDDQPWNYGPYNGLMIDMSSNFEVSKQAIEIKLKQMRLLNDQRQRRNSPLKYF